MNLFARIAERRAALARERASVERLVRMRGWRLAADPASRAVGLLGTGPDRPWSACVLWPCGAVHTFGMRQPIDIAFVSSDLIVLDLRPGVQPGRVHGCRGARITVEVMCGQAHPLGLWIGTRLLDAIEEQT